MNGSFTLASDNTFDASKPSTYPERLRVRVPRPDTPYTTVHSGGLFLQDKWRIDNLTLNLGVRYDVHIAPITAFFNPLFDDPDAYPVDKNNIAPRLGFAYDAGGNSVIRGGYGRFYERLWVNRFEPFVRNGVYASSFLIDFPLDDIDPGPSQGMFPTHPLLVNGPVLNRDLVNQFAPPGLSRNLGVGVAGHARASRRPPGLVVVRLRARAQNRRSRSASTTSSSGAATCRCATTSRPRVRAGNEQAPTRSPASTSWGSPTSSGSRRSPATCGSSRTTPARQYDGLNFQIEKRYADNWSARVAYTLGYARGNNDGDPNDEVNVAQVMENRNLDLLWGPSTVRPAPPPDPERADGDTGDRGRDPQRRRPVHDRHPVHDPRQQLRSGHERTAVVGPA